MAGPSEELQGAIYRALSEDAVLSSMIGGVYDRVQRASDGTPAPSVWGEANGYISFGPESTITSSGGCVDLLNVEVQLDIWSRQVGRIHAKRIIHEARRVLRGIETIDNPIVSRGEPFEDIRQDPDGLTAHGILRVEFEMESHG